MANEYFVNLADMTSVADAIREKGETTEQLVFPADFLTAIKNIKGGADFNFEIVGGTTQPSSPKENTIWVNTPNEITGWGFGEEADRPATPATGMVWFATTRRTDAGFNALKQDAIFVYPSTAHQYDSTAWVAVNAKIYKNGAWVEWWKGQLYTPGNEWESVTGGWYSTGYIAGEQISPIVMAVSRTRDNIVFSGSFTKDMGSKATHYNPVSRLNYNTLTIDLSVKRTSPIDCVLAIVGENGAVISQNRIINGNNDYSGTVNMDVSGVDGRFYFEVRIWTWRELGSENSVTIRRVALS